MKGDNSNLMDDRSDRIKSLDARIEQLKRARRKVQQKERELARKRDTRRKILIGAVVLGRARVGDEKARALVSDIVAGLESGDAELFRDAEVFGVSDLSAIGIDGGEVKSEDQSVDEVDAPGEYAAQ